MLRVRILFALCEGYNAKQTDPNPLTDYGFLEAKYFFAAYCRTPPVPIECVSYSIVFIEQGCHS